MNTKSSMDDLELRAIEALQMLLGQVSVIKLKEIRREAKGSVLARIDVLGHSHMLACEVKDDMLPDELRSTLHGLRAGASNRCEWATPVLIAPYLSPETQALCTENQAGFLDLEGNARIVLGEVFIGKRTITPRAPVVPVKLPPARALYRMTHPARFQATSAA